MVKLDKKTKKRIRRIKARDAERLQRRVKAGLGRLVVRDLKAQAPNPVRTKEEAASEA